MRFRELETWVVDFSIPIVVWLPGTFNPQAVLTSVMQTAARKNDWPLDKVWPPMTPIKEITLVSFLDEITL